MANRVCACGCGRDLLPASLAAGDPFYSRKCAEAARGLSAAADRPQGSAGRKKGPGPREPMNALQMRRAEADREARARVARLRQLREDLR